MLGPRHLISLSAGYARSTLQLPSVIETMCRRASAGRPGPAPSSQPERPGKGDESAAPPITGGSGKAHEAAAERARRSDRRDAPYGLTAVVANLLVALAKGVAALITGSAALWAETLHSIADTGNEVLLFIGVHRSKRKEDPRHPFGYGQERYFWALLAALGIFVLGGVLSIGEESVASCGRSRSSRRGSASSSSSRRRASRDIRGAWRADRCSPVRANWTGRSSSIWPGGPTPPRPRSIWRTPPRSSASRSRSPRWSCNCSPAGERRTAWRASASGCC